MASDLRRLGPRVLARRKQWMIYPHPGPLPAGEGERKALSQRESVLCAGWQVTFRRLGPRVLARRKHWMIHPHPGPLPAGEGERKALSQRERERKALSQRERVWMREGITSWRRRGRLHALLTIHGEYAGVKYRPDRPNSRYKPFQSALDLQFRSVAEGIGVAPSDGLDDLGDEVVDLLGRAADVGHGVEDGVEVDIAEHFLGVESG